MGIIHKLDLQTAQSIAAGEVVERPASVVKELIENSLDAGADRISIAIEQGGKKSIRITDNGQGMAPEDARMAFEQHATSKIRAIEDLDGLLTMGFRGEALPTISAVSRVTMLTRDQGESGTKITIEGGELLENTETQTNRGTTLEVRDLFYNTPARFKFLKQDQSEGQKITEVVQEQALARPDVSFYLENQGKEILHTPGDNRLLSAIYAVFGQQLAKAMVPVLPAEQVTVRCSGFLALPEQSRKSRNWQYFFVNGRPIKSPVLTRAVEDAYKSTLMTGKFPAFVLKLDLPLNLVDVNVHPRKLEVRFWNDSEVFKAIYEQVQNSLFTALRPPELVTETDDPPVQEASAPVIFPKETIESREKPFLQFDFNTGSQKIQERQVAYRASQPEESTEVPLSAPVNLGQQMTMEEETETPTDERSQLLFSLKNAKYAGEVFRTYLLFEYDDTILLIDQHAAHEKILFEEAVSNYHKNKRLSSQVLLEPARMEISPSDESFIEGNQTFLSDYGFDVDSFGPGVLLIRAIPVSREWLDPARALRYLLDEAQEHGIDRVQGENEFLYHLLATNSCKAAVKAHDTLHELEVEALRERLIVLDNPFHCPHGRPVLIKIRRSELEKLFKRIV